MRTSVIPFNTDNKVDLLLAKPNIKDIKKHTPATNHKFLDIIKFFINSLPNIVDLIYCFFMLQPIWFRMVIIP